LLRGVSGEKKGISVNVSDSDSRYLYVSAGAVGVFGLSRLWKKGSSTIEMKESRLELGSEWLVAKAAVELVREGKL
jgi:hypothetical protein